MAAPDADAMIAWVRRSAYRFSILLAVWFLNREGKYPSGSEAINRARHFNETLAWVTSSGRSCARQAIRDLIARGFLTNRSGRRNMELAVGGVVSDMLEEQGRPRLEDGDYI